MESNGHIIIFTPPYWPDYQTIETCWAVVKNFVADCWKSGRKIENLKNQTRVAFYGGEIEGRTAKGIDPSIIKIINESYRFIEKQPAILKTKMFPRKIIAGCRRNTDALSLKSGFFGIRLLEEEAF